MGSDSQACSGAALRTQHPGCSVEASQTGQDRAVMMEQPVQAAIQRTSPNLNKQEDKTAQQCQGWGLVGVFFQVNKG